MIEKVASSMEEQEFHVNYSPDMGKMCEVYTTIPWAMKHLEKLVNKYPDICKVIKDDRYSYTVQIPFKLVKPRAPRVIPEEQRLLAAERLKNARRPEKVEQDS